MRPTSSLLPFTACALIASLAACRADDKGTETASRSSSTGAAAGAPTNEVPVTTASSEARTIYLQGRELSDQLRAHDARKLFQQAAAKDPNFALVHYELAIISPSPKEFRKHLDEAVKLSKNASEGERLMILALEAGANDDSKKSLEYTEELARKYPRDARAQTFLGFAYSQVQEFDKAIAALTEATEANPEYAPAYNLLGYMYMPQRKYAEAETAFKKYIELVPDEPNPYDSYGELLMLMGRFDESIAQYRKALSKDPNFSGSRVGIAANLMYQGKHDAAAAEAQKLYDAARDDGDRRNAMFTRAVIYVDGGRTAQALREMEKLYTLDAKGGDTAGMSGDAQQIGDILLEAGRTDEAAKRYRQALALVENSGLSAEQKEIVKLSDHYNLARVALAKGDLAGAKTHAEQFRTGAEATQDVGRIHRAHELVGMIALGEKKYDEAAGHLEQADQQDLYVLYLLATAYQRKGDTAKAKDFAKRAADAHILPTLRYGFVRRKAMQMA